ncbi:MAG: putative AlkP superfamily pyrophosphatase or phosphodiesterase [Candidatus Aldehydirespiratoraceae bacterium]|jgi:predicted AlkP superfamily pyrophosphatase or phosphodiesterase
MSPIIPDYAGANVRGIIPAILGPTSWANTLPNWMPDAVRAADAVVMLVIDGLGWDQLQDHAHLAPTMMSMQGQSIHTVAPTTTATALSSITTGLTPGEHGLVGYRMALGGEVMNVLRWAVGDQQVRRSHPPREVQPFEPFLGERVPVVAQGELQKSGFSEAHLRGCDPVGWRSPSSIAVEAAAQVAAGERFVYCYYNGVDKIAHERGFGPFYDAELRFSDLLVAELIGALPAGTAVIVTADHGQVDVGKRILHPSDELLGPVAMQSGEGRFRWLHCRPGDVATVADAATSEFGDVAWVVTKEQVLDEAWFGPTVAPPIQRRLGDVALCPFEPVSFHEDGDSGPFELVCRHGSLTSAEVNVPLLGTYVG